MATYTQITREAALDPNRSFWWIFATAATAGLLSILTRLQVDILQGSTATTALATIQQRTPGLVPLFVMIYVAAFTITMPIGFLGATGLIHGLVSVLGGRGAFRALLFTYGAGSLPIIIVSSIFREIPELNFLTYIGYLYSTIVLVYAVRSVYSLNKWQSLVIAVVAVVIQTITVGFLFLLSAAK